jgi:hypothetical protein
VQNDPLQRVYGIAFPEKAQMKQWEDFQQKAKERDHRRFRPSTHPNFALLKGLMLMQDRTAAGALFCTPTIPWQRVLATAWSEDIQ